MARDHQCNQAILVRRRGKCDSQEIRKSRRPGRYPNESRSNTGSSRGLENHLHRSSHEAHDLPDGAEVVVVVIDAELSVEERAALHASLDRAVHDSEAGRGVAA